MAQSPQHKREAAETLGGVENSLKVQIGRVKALGDPAFIGKLAAAEADLQRRTNAPANANPWTDVAGAMRAYRDFYVADRFSTPSGDLFGYALTLVRAAEERGKPNADRFPGLFRFGACRCSKSACSTSAPSTPGWTN